MKLSHFAREQIQKSRVGPFKIEKTGYGSHLVDGKGWSVEPVTFGGNSKQRRQQRKAYMKQVEQAQLEALLIGGQ